MASVLEKAGAVDDSEEAQALSGLARAFFYAGSRALLVSHWEVDTDASVALITSAVGAIKRDPTIGRSEALRRAILAMIDPVGLSRRIQPTGYRLSWWARELRRGNTHQGHASLGGYESLHIG